MLRPLKRLSTKTSRSFLRHPEDDVLQDERLDLACGFRSGLGSKIEDVQFCPSQDLPVACQEKVAGDLQQERLGFQDLDRLDLAQEAQIGFLRQIFGEIGP